jgi:hypothetical protein
MVRYFEWIGAAMYTSDQRSGAMHGKSFLLDSVYAGIDENNVYGRLDFVEEVPSDAFELVVNIESWAVQNQRPRSVLRLDVGAHDRAISSWRVSESAEEEVIASSDSNIGDVKIVLARNFEFSLPLRWLLAAPVSSTDHVGKAAGPVATRLRLRFSLWKNNLPADALPLEGWIELALLPEEELAAMAF